MMNRVANSLSDIVNLFKPMALTGEQAAFYQKTAMVRDGARYEFHDGIYERIRVSSTYERLLVVGHGGCGKSTELLMLMSKLEQNGAPVVLVEAKDDLDLYSFSYIDLFLLIIEKLSQFASTHKLKIDKGIISAFKKALSTKITQEYWNAGTELDAEASASVTASIPMFLSIMGIVGSTCTRLYVTISKIIRRCWIEANVNVPV